MNMKISKEFSFITRQHEREEEKERPLCKAVEYNNTLTFTTKQQNSGINSSVYFFSWKESENGNNKRLITSLLRSLHAQMNNEYYEFISCRLMAHFVHFSQWAKPIQLLFFALLFKKSSPSGTWSYVYFKHVVCKIKEKELNLLLKNFHIFSLVPSPKVSVHQ